MVGGRKYKELPCIPDCNNYLEDIGVAGRKLVDAILVVAIVVLCLSGCGKEDPSFPEEMNKSTLDRVSSDPVPSETDKMDVNPQISPTDEPTPIPTTVVDEVVTLEDIYEEIPEEEWQTDENTIIWAVCLTPIEELEVLEQVINNKLKADGYPFRLKCIEMTMKNYGQKIKECPADIVFTGLQENGVPCAYSAIHEGKYLNLDKYLEGSELYDFFPEGIWNSVKVNGSIFCIPNMNFYDTCFSVIIKKSAYTSEQIDSFDGSLEGILRLVSADHKLYMGCGLGSYLDMYGVPNYGQDGIYFENDEERNIMDLELNIEWLRALNNLWKKGWLIDNSDSLTDRKDDWTIALYSNGAKSDVDESEYIVINYQGDINHHFAGSIAIRENSHNPQYAFEMIELFLTNSDYGNAFIYSDDIIDENGYAVDKNTGELVYSWNARMVWGICDGILKGMGDNRKVFDTKEERKVFYGKYMRAAKGAPFTEEFCELWELAQKHEKIIYNDKNFEEELAKWIEESDKIIQKYNG